MSRYISSLVLFFLTTMRSRMVATSAELTPFRKESSSSRAVWILQLLHGDPAFFLLRFHSLLLQLQLPELMVEGIVALFELRRRESALDAHLEQAILFDADSGNVRFHALCVPSVIVFLRNGPDDIQHGVHDRLSILRQFVKDLRQDQIQLAARI